MASAVIGALRVNLGIDTAQFEEGLKGVRASLDRVGKNLQAMGTKFTTYVTAPIMAAGTAIGVAVNGIAKDAKELGTLSQVANAGFEEFQRLAHAAKTVGIESDKLADIYKDINDRVGDFVQTGGGPMADFFENIAPKVGITADAFKELSGPQALQLYYDSLVKAGVSQQDMTFYLEAMASDVTALIPLLRDGGAEFARLGQEAAVLSDSDAAGLQKWNDATRQLGEAVKAVTIAIATSGLLDWMTEAAQAVTAWVQWLSQTNPEILKWGTVVAGLAAAIGPVLISLGLLASGIAAISAPVALTVAGIAALTAGVIAFWPEIVRAGEAITAFVSGAWAAFVAGWDAVTEKVAAVSLAVGQFASDLIATFAALPARMMEIGRQIIDGLWLGLQERWQGVKDSVSGFASGIVDSFRSTLGIHSPSTVMMEVGRNIMQGLFNGMQSMQPAVEGVAGSLESVFSNIGNSIAQAIQGTKDWKDVALDALKAIANHLLSSVFGGGGFGGGGLGGIFGSLISGIFGGLFGFARGGTILPGGGGGIDSQLVAFHKSPNERVDITKPGQTLEGGQAVDVRVSVDNDGNLQAFVDRVANQRAGQTFKQGMENFWRSPHENGGGKLDHGSGGIVLLRAA